MAQYKGRPKSRADIKTPVPKLDKTANPNKTTRPKQLVAPTHPTQSPIQEISDLLDNLPLKACVELIRRLLTSVTTLPTGPARPRAVFKIVILFIVEYGSTA
jgi:hypothetical protein